MHLKHWLEGSVYQMRSGSNIFSYLCNVTRQLAWLLLFSVCAMKNILVSNKHTIYLLHSPSSTQLLSRPTIAPIRTPSDPPSALDHLWTFATHYTLVFCLHLTWHAMGTIQTVTGDKMTRTVEVQRRGIPVMAGYWVWCRPRGEQMETPNSFVC